MTAGAFVYSSFATSDLDEGYAFLLAAYADLTLKAKGPTGQVEFAADLLTFGDVSIGRLHAPISAVVDVPDGVTEPRVSILRQARGGMDFETAADPAVPLGPGGTMLAPANVRYRSRWDFLHSDTALIGNELLADCAAADVEAGVPLSFDFSGVVSAAAADTWRRMTTLVRRIGIAAAQSNTDGRLLADELARLVASTALVCFPNSTMAASGSSPHRPSPASLRRAVAFIDDNLDRPISLAEIAGAARVTPRALNLTFNRHLGTSPFGYVRRARLAHAHHDLRAAQPGAGQTVTAIAARWGFHSLPRFGVLYRQTYGRPPSHTLRRS